MKLFLRVFVAVGLIVSLFFLPPLLKARLTTDEFFDELDRRRSSYFHGCLELWQIDSFEGGIGSRTYFLQSLTPAFEKGYNGVFVRVKNVPPALAARLIKEGQTPDMISFGAGVVSTGALLQTLTVPREQLRPDIRSACFGDALPWCMGAYLMIGEGEREAWGKDGREIQTKKARKKIYSVGLSTREGYASKTLLKPAGITLTNELSLLEGSASSIFEAYNYARSVNRMIGTQRDLYRLETARSREKMRPSQVRLMPEYDDLFQYIALFACEDELKNKIMNDFVSYLLSEDVQDRLGAIGLFPVTLSAKPEYAIPEMTEAWQQVKNAKISCVSTVYGDTEAMP